MANFDSVARPYALLERLVFGDTLLRARLAHLDLLAKIEPGKFLLTGEGDGRFLEHLVKAHPASEFAVIDSSERMLERTRQRLATIPHQRPVQLFQTDILAPELDPNTPPKYDAVISHFFLDCFTESEVESIAEKVTRRLAPGGLWIVTDFQNKASLHQKLLLRFMYRFFRLTANLRIQRLPEYHPILARNKFTPVAHATFKGGFITSVAYCAEQESASHKA